MNVVVVNSYCSNPEVYGVNRRDIKHILLKDILIDNSCKQPSENFPFYAYSDRLITVDEVVKELIE